MTTTCRKNPKHEYRVTAKGGYCYTCDRERAEREKTDRKRVTKPSDSPAPSPAESAFDSLSRHGRQFMAMVGRRDFDFFDEGIVAQSGNWGESMAWQFAQATDTHPQSVSGIMSHLSQTELWEVVEDDSQTWWQLTALGAEVALLAASKAP